MSVAIVKLEIPLKSGEELLPDFFTNDLLIVLIRELTRVIQGRMTQQEMSEFGMVMREYIRKVVLTLGEDQLEHLNRNPEQLFHALFEELHEYLRDELVSRQICYLIQEKTLAELFRERLAAL